MPTWSMPIRFLTCSMLPESIILFLLNTLTIYAQFKHFCPLPITSSKSASIQFSSHLMTLLQKLIIITPLFSFCKKIIIQRGGNSGKINEIFYQFPEHIVFCVSPVIARRPGRRVRKYDWRPRVPQGVQHRILRDVRDVHHHSQPVHLQDDSLMEGSNQPHILYFQLDLQLIPFQSH